MDNTQKANSKFEAIAWGLIFIWWGITELLPALPEGIGAIGIGIILLGVNMARSRNDLPTSRFSTVLGILTLVWGGLELLGILAVLPFEIPVFPILLIVLGALILAPALKTNPGGSVGNPS